MKALGAFERLETNVSCKPYPKQDKEGQEFFFLVLPQGASSWKSLEGIGNNAPRGMTAPAYYK